jgi:hypothetical protein
MIARRESGPRRSKSVDVRKGRSHPAALIEGPPDNEQLV